MSAKKLLKRNDFFAAWRLDCCDYVELIMVLTEINLVMSNRSAVVLSLTVQVICVCFISFVIGA